MTDTLRERIAFEVFHECEFGDDDQESSRLAWERAKSEYTSAARPAFAAADRILSLLDSPVGEPEPHDCERWQTEGLCCALCNPVATMRGPLPEHDPYRRSKLPGAVISDDGETLELARQDGFVAGAFWAARYVDERDMKPTGAEISHEAQAHSRMRMKQPGGPFETSVS